MNEKSCFVIGPIGDLGSETRKRSDFLLNNLIHPAVRECGFGDPLRADHIPEPGMITHQIIKHLVESSLVVADLTELNANVFYELAVRHMTRKPCIQFMVKGTKIPFDISGVRTIQVDHMDDEGVGAARKEMVKQIKAGEASGSVRSPIADAMELMALAEGNRPGERTLGEMRDELKSLKREINLLGTNVAQDTPDLRDVSSAKALAEILENQRMRRGR